MEFRGKDGVAKREHYKKAAGGMFPNAEAAARLAKAPRLPMLTADVWAKFLHLHARRQRDMENNPLRFSWVEIQAYKGAAGIDLDPFTLRLIFALEDAYFEVQAENKPK